MKSVIMYTVNQLTVNMSKGECEREREGSEERERRERTVKSERGRERWRG